jgi:hypothetical protein
MFPTLIVVPAFIINAGVVVKVTKSGSVIGILVAVSGRVTVIFPPVMLPPACTFRAAPV